MDPKIYVADDYQIQLNILVRFLKKQYSHLDIVGFINPIEALDQIIINKPEILILDQIMPKLDGSELLKIIKKIYSPKATLLISTLDYDTDLFDYYLPKPFDYNDLKFLIDIILSDIYKSINVEIDGTLSNIKGSIKDKLFLKNVLLLLKDIIDDKEPQNESIYKLVSEKMDNSPDTIRKHMKRIRTNNQDKFGNITTIELIRKLLFKIRKGRS